MAGTTADFLRVLPRQRDVRMQGLSGCRPSATVDDATWDSWTVTERHGSKDIPHLPRCWVGGLSEYGHVLQDARLATRCTFIK